MGEDDRTGCLRNTSPAKVVTSNIKGPISRQLRTTHTTTEARPAWRVRCWHVASMESWGCLHTRKCPTAQKTGNENGQTRKRVSIHQQSKRAGGGPMRGVKLCAVQSKQYTSGPVLLKDHINDVTWNSMHADSCWCPTTEIHSKLRKYCRYILFKDFRQSLVVPFFNAPFPAAPEVWCFTGYLIFTVNSRNGRVQKSKLFRYSGGIMSIISCAVYNVTFKVSREDSPL